MLLLKMQFKKFNMQLEAKKTDGYSQCHLKDKSSKKKKKKVTMLIIFNQVLW